MDIDTAIEKNPKAKKRIEGLANRAKLNEALLEVADSIGMKQLISITVDQILEMDITLMNDGRWVSGKKERLDPLDRAEMVGKRDALMSLVEVFPHAKRSLKLIEDKITRYAKK